MDPERLGRFILDALGWPEWIRFYQKPVQAVAAARDLRRAQDLPAGIVWDAPGTGAALDSSKEMPGISVLRADWAPTPQSLKVAQERAREMGRMVLLDETATAFRLAPGGAREHYSLEPDAVILGPPQACGHQFAALIGRGPEPAESGHAPGPDALAAAMAVVQKAASPDFSAHIVELGRMFYAGLEYYARKAKVEEDLGWHGPPAMPRLEGRRLWAFLALAKEEGLTMRPLLLHDPRLTPEDVAQRMWVRLARACARLRVLPQGDMAPLGWKDAASNVGCSQA